MPSFKLLDSQNDSQYTPNCTPEDPISANPLPKSSNVEVSMPICSVRPSEEPELLPRRNKDVSAVFKSPFIERNINVFANLSQMEKIIAAFAFDEELDDSIVMFYHGKFVLTRFDLKSLLSEVKISSNLVNVWGQILNKQEENKSADSPLRLFATVTDKGLMCADVVDFAKLMLMFFPFSINAPILICVNFITSKIEVIHPMAPKSISYMDHVQAVKDFINCYMVAKSKRFELVSKFRVEEYVPKLNIIEADTGIHMMRHMEVYKGNRRSFSTGITKQFPNNGPAEVVLNRLKFKYCHAILLSDLNAMKDTVTRDAKTLNIKYGKQVDLKQPTDEDLLANVFSNSLDKDEIVVDTEWVQATRKELSTLSPGVWLMDVVIDMMGLYVTTSRTDLLYIPTTSRTLCAKRDKRIGTNYMTCKYMATDGSKYTHVFIPLLQDNHWYLCVCDFKQKQKYILDSLPQRRPVKRNDNAVTVVSNVADIMSRSDGYKHFLAMKSFPCCNVSVPRQADGFNCGVYVLKWLQARDDHSLWTSLDYYHDLAKYRNEVVIKLLLWDKNKKVFS